MKNPSSKHHGLPVVHERAAGIDIGSRFHVVAVPAEITEESVQTFKAFTTDVECMANWLVDLGITTVAMESTQGVLDSGRRDSGKPRSACRTCQCARCPRSSWAQNRH